MALVLFCQATLIQVPERSINKCLHLKLLFQPSHADDYCTARSANQFWSEKKKSIVEFGENMDCSTKDMIKKIPHNLQLSNLQPLI